MSTRGLNVERDDSERLSADDTATLREEEFRAAALREHEFKAAKAAPVVHGECANCGEPLPPQVVYCDADCRADHEHRQRLEARAGKAA